MHTTAETTAFGVCVWSTGNTALDFVRQLDLPLSKDGRIRVDDKLQVEGHYGVYAIGDCAANPNEPLPMIAQAAKQQATYLGKVFNKGLDKPFNFQFMGSMTQLGTWHGVMKGPSVGGKEFKLKGVIAWIIWRSAYWGYQVSITNKILIPMYWFKSYWFGRDISKF